jgi:hypothetical protein
MKRKIFFVLILSIVFTNIYAQKKQSKAVMQITGNKYFVENKGQWNEEVLYMCHMGGLNAWITKNGVAYDFYKIESKEENELNGHYAHKQMREEHKNTRILGHNVFFRFVNRNKSFKTEALDKQTAYYNYFIGKDQSKYATKVGLYKEIMLKNVYDGIDIRYYFDNGAIRYDFIVMPGADPGQIKFKLEGTDKTYVNSKGSLVFITRFGETEMANLTSYQGNKEIISSFVKKGDFWTIKTGDYDKTKTLIIDPLVYSTYIGGDDVDKSVSISISPDGNAYITGFTYLDGYPITIGAYQTTCNGGYETFISKLNSDGTSLLYSTFIGGYDYDYGTSIFVDNSGNAYVTGYTYSTDFPVIGGGFQTTNAGGYDAFVTKFNSDGTDLLYSTFIGGSEFDYAESIVVDNSGSAYITGYTTGSDDFPVTSGAYQTSIAGGHEVFVSKLNPLGSDLVYSTFVGGSSMDQSSSIAIDADGNAYITGSANSTDFPTTIGAFQPTSAGYPDIFVTKLNAYGTNLIYSTFLGGLNSDEGNSIVVDSAGNAYITGSTYSPDYPVTSNAFQTTNAGEYDIIVTKLNSEGSDLVYSTYIGGSGDEEAASISLDNSNHAYITGNTDSENFPTISNSFQPDYADSVDAFVTKLSIEGTSLVYSTYLGGTDFDYGYSIFVDSAGNTYVTGTTYSHNYPISNGVYQSDFANDKDAFVTKFFIENIGANSEIGESNANVEIYPNPTSGIVNVDLGNLKDYSLGVTDMLGKEVYKAEHLNAQNYVIDLKGNPGVYMLEVKSIEGVQRFKLIIK